MHDLGIVASINPQCARGWSVYAKLRKLLLMIERGTLESPVSADS